MKQIPILVALAGLVGTDIVVDLILHFETRDEIEHVRDAVEKLRGEVGSPAAQPSNTPTVSTLLKEILHTAVEIEKRGR
jgi:hypothetical protein